MVKLPPKDDNKGLRFVRSLFVRAFARVTIVEDKCFHPSIIFTSEKKKMEGHDALRASHHLVEGVCHWM